MGKLHNDKRISSKENQVPVYANVSPTSPLDLSRTSKVFPFFHRSSSNDDYPTSPMDVSEKGTQIDWRPTSTDFPYDAPVIITQPKEEWHYRSVNDLARNHLPLLPGNGPQRTPIRVNVPASSNQQMYLAIAIVTHDGHPHDSKVIVPAKTKVNAARLSHENNLDCLQFDECNSTDFFHPVMRYVYSKITIEEHIAQLKEVKIHMFNLYQNQKITKEIIETQQLHLCKLSFWFCVVENERYKPVSQSSFSSVIQEKKMNNRPRMSQQINNRGNLSIPPSPMCEECLNQENMNTGNNIYLDFATNESN